ncbi:hypothetical protein FRB94_007902 [Tulasnella sp. JGI-2019a]|nr:hypothetical protein FRB93_002076 [Tulasnella sp. JGI-2019a]KAG8996996.1 hypothetical protein FRB94_007902 [Tulasnella sp. JGI-2019a]KAG9025596.1 hypothetical protein FRB95_009976 [Tulasnella sp. JGI-2019a]
MHISFNAHWYSADTVSTNVKPINTVSGDFIGTIAANASDNCFKVDDVVSGYVRCASWVNSLSDSNQGAMLRSMCMARLSLTSWHQHPAQTEYLYVRPEDVWCISATEAKEFGIDYLTGGSGCTVM